MRKNKAKLLDLKASKLMISPHESLYMPNPHVKSINCDFLALDVLELHKFQLLLGKKVPYWQTMD